MQTNNICMYTHPYMHTKSATVDPIYCAGDDSRQQLCIVTDNMT